MPAHVRIMSWLPQPDILRHPTTKVFLSHGGLKSFKETVCMEVPVLVMPIFGDQYRNALEAKGLGFGNFVEKQSLTSKGLEAKIRSVAENESFKKRIQLLKAAMVDRPVPSLQAGAHALQMVIKHKGAPRIWYRKGRDLWWFQYWCIDILMVAVLILVASIHVTRKAILSLLQSCRKQ